VDSSGTQELQTEYKSVFFTGTPSLSTLRSRIDEIDCSWFVQHHQVVIEISRPKAKRRSKAALECFTFFCGFLFREQLLEQFAREEFLTPIS
jgi:hypothetical protein